MTKINSRPISVEDRIDQSRDIAGVNKWAQSSRTVGFIMFLLGWFTIPAEVLLRKDFGQRWFTVVNFYAGLFLLIIFSTVQYIWTWLWAAFEGIVDDIASAINPLYRPSNTSTLLDRVTNRSMLYMLIAYTVLGSYHLFKIWWRNRTNSALHSFDDGTSRLEAVAKRLSRIVNVLAVPFVKIYTRLLPEKQRTGIAIPKLINDQTKFANTVIEPLLLFILGYWMHGMISLWLLLSTIAMAIHANWRETAKLNKILDFKDSILEAKSMMQLKDEHRAASEPARMMHQAAEAMKENPHIRSNVGQQYPDLASIIEEMNEHGA